MKFVIMAGGQGTKLWPASRDSVPKQFQKIIGEKTLFQLNLESLLLKYSPSDIFVSINDEYIKFVREQAPQIPEENYIIEPKLKKDTGPASGYAMLKVAHQFPNEVVMFYVQPVVVRTPPEKYIEMVEGIEKIVERDHKLVTGGQIPRYAEVGSDYLELGDKVEAMNSLEVYNVKKFVDRPKTEVIAEELIKTHRISTHCNHYTWTPELLMSAFKEIRPDWYEVLLKIKGVIGTENEYEKVKKLYEEFQPGRIEELTRHLFDSNRVQVVILPFKWTHITTWNDVYEYCSSENIDMLQGKIRNVESKNVLVREEVKDKLVAIIGLDDIIVVDTPDCLLITRKDKTNNVKIIHEQLKAEGLEKYL